MAQPQPIGPADVSDMTRHWLGCPPCGYLGSDYGSDVQAIVNTPQSAGLADELIEKFRQDIPLVARLPAGAINLYAFNQGVDKKVIVFDVAGQLVSITGS